MQFDDNGNLLSFDGTPILLSGEVPRDADVLALLETYRPGLDGLYAEVVGATKVGNWNNGQTNVDFDVQNCWSRNHMRQKI